MKEAQQIQRIHLSLSKAEMARLLRVHQGTWNKWESGERAMNAAAATCLELMIWLHDEHRSVYEEWMKK